MKFVVVLFALVMFWQCEAKQLSRCELVRELRKHGFPENKMRDWVCLVENESSRRTHIVSKPNSDGSKDYGLFQINSRYWCSTSDKPGKDCNVTCKQLITDDISKASACAKKIFQRHGFDAWYGWKNKCQGKPLPDISSVALSYCNLNIAISEISTSNITKAAACARKIHQREGFGAWSGWKKHCEGKQLPDISSCKHRKV